MLYKKAFENMIQVFRKHYRNYFSLVDILNEIEDIQRLLEIQLLHYSKYKVNILVQVEYILKGIDNETTEKEISNLKSSNFFVSKTLSRISLKNVSTKHC